jgi:(S)-ureidoglycine---glyoxylate transaminase
MRTAGLGAEFATVDAEWGQVVAFDRIAAAARDYRPSVIACVHGDTSTTMAQPLDGLGDLCREIDAYSYVDATATLGGMSVPVDRWGADIVTAGLQKCMGGPSGSAPITISDRASEFICSRRHT